MKLRHFAHDDLAALDIQASQADWAAEARRPGPAAGYLEEHGCLWTAEHEGRVVGIGGAVEMPGDVPLFVLLLSDEVRAKPLFVARTARLFLARIGVAGITKAHTDTDDACPEQARWVGWLGFRCVGPAGVERGMHRWEWSHGG